MQLPAYTISQCHLEDLHRAAAASALRAEARSAAAERQRPRSRELVLRRSIVRRMVARLAV
jgi:hypothetical protein